MSRVATQLAVQNARTAYVLSRGENGLSATDIPGVIIIPQVGPTTFPYGLRGSLTELADGSPYLIAGENITIMSQANGPITISAELATSITAGGSDTHVQFNDGGSALGGDSAFVFNKSTDTLTVTNIKGSLTELSDGSPYLIAGEGIAITTGVNGAVTIAAPSLGATWQTYTPTLTSLGDALTLPTAHNLYGRYLVQDRLMTLMFSYSAASVSGATAGSGAYTISIPEGYEIDTGVVTLGTSPSYIGGTSLGTAALLMDAADTGGGWSVIPASSSTLVLVGKRPSQTENPLVWGSSNFPLNHAGDYRVSFVLSIPVLP
jgi:hypothetical protein